MNAELSEVANRILHYCIKNNNTQIFTLKDATGIHVCGERIDIDRCYQYEKAFLELERLHLLKRTYSESYITYEGICSLGDENYTKNKRALCLKHILKAASDSENKVIIYLPNEGMRFGDEQQNPPQIYSIEDAKYRSAIELAEKLGYIKFNPRENYWRLTDAGVNYIVRTQK